MIVVEGNICVAVLCVDCIVAVTVFGTDIVVLFGDVAADAEEAVVDSVGVVKREEEDNKEDDNGLSDDDIADAKFETVLFGID